MQAITVSGQIVSTEGHCFPLAVGPAANNTQSLAEFVAAHASPLRQQLTTYGAILLRGFPKSDEPNDFAEASDSLGLRPYPYVGGAAPRHLVAQKGEAIVFTTNESPPDQPIPFHHELAQTPNPPPYIAFFCAAEPKSGGETPIILSAEVARYFQDRHPEFYKKCQQHGIRYVRVMPETTDESSPIGRSWKETFMTSTREEAEAAMRKLGTTWQWNDADNSVRTVTAAVPALRTDPRTGKVTFFNSIVAAYTGWIDARNDPTKSVVLGDGSPVDGDALLDIQKWQLAHRASVAWKKGDMLLIDNSLVMHSRNSFEPPRRVLAFIGGLPLDIKNNFEGPTLTLRSGDTMPVMGTGMWKVPKDITPSVVVGALQAGYRLLDCACDYGNEKEVGEGIRQAIAAGVIKSRDELFITSKLWNTYHAEEHVRLACERTLSDLGVKYVDLYLIHFPIALRFVPFEARYPPEWVYDPTVPVPRMEYAQVSMAETWRGMEKLVDAGLVRNIGVCNVTAAAIRDLFATARIPPAVLQVEEHPYLPQTALNKYCASEGIAVTAFSPLGSGSYESLGSTSPQDSVLIDPVVTTIATKHKVTPAQIVLGWAVQRGISVIPKSSSIARLKENLASVNIRLDEQDMAAMNSLDKTVSRRFNDPGKFTQFMNSYCPIFD
eukprot:c13262_g1_i1.p1 GENE.c13262_g1_i1~~c13262_g1_i1.p1  ORF type:complete len:673 (-),score=161.66 c13262_g1_i1:149-2137(-)